MAEKKSGFMDTRGALLDAAFALLKDRGLEDTPVDAIIAKARLSKGTFFHYFKTKDALLAAVAERLAEQGWRVVEPTLKGPGEPLEKLASYLARGRRFRIDHASELGEVWDTLTLEHNAPLRARVSRAYREHLRPHIAELIAAGAAKGQFQVEDPATTTDLLLEFVEASAEGSMRLLRAGGPDVAERAARRVNATLIAVERILGAEKGVLLRVCAATLEPFQTARVEVDPLQFERKT